MFPLCYAQLPGYLQRIVFPLPNILQHYTKFDVHTIIMLEKLLGSRSFGTTLDHLVHCQIIFLLLHEGVKASLSGQMCCAHLFKMLNFDRSYINLWFPIG
jgi:hypothetical protein